MAGTTWTATDALIASPILSALALIGCFAYARWERLQAARVLVPVRVRARRPGGGTGC